MIVSIFHFPFDIFHFGHLKKIRLDSGLVRCASVGTSTLLNGYGG